MKRIAFSLLLLGGMVGAAAARELDGLGAGVNVYAFGQADKPGLGLEAVQVFSGAGERDILFGVELGFINNKDDLAYTRLPSTTTLASAVDAKRSVRNGPEYFGVVTAAIQTMGNAYIGVSAVVTMESISYLSKTPTGALVANDEATKTHIGPGLYVALKTKKGLISSGYDARRGARLGYTYVFGRG